MDSMEIKTVYMPAAEYIAKYRDIPKFLEYCKVCPRYDLCWACPTHSFDVDHCLDAFRHVYITGAKVPVPDEVRQKVKGKDAVAEMAERLTKEARSKLDPIMLGLEQQIPNALCCYGGTCYLCAACSKIQGEPCRFPEKRRSSLEALGFDVVATTETLLGFPVLWSMEELPPYITIVSALFTKEELSEGL